MKLPQPSSSTTMAPPGALVRDQLAELVRSAGSELFASLDLALTHDGTFDPSQPVWSDPVSFLGFGGEKMAGSLVVSAPWPPMAQTSPVGEHQPEVLADWSRELANMMLGGLKIALLRRGLHVQIGLPTSIVSTDLRISTASRSAIGERFRLGAHALLVALDCVVAPDLVLRAPEALNHPSAGDGILLF